VDVSGNISSGGAVAWTCNSSKIKGRYLPQVCTSAAGN
jgi:hypothetical protein